MTASTRPLLVGAEGGSAPFVLARSILSTISTSARVCADYFAAAAAYEQLSGLSEGELLRRGLTRATLARDICQSLDSARPKGGRIPPWKSVD